MQKGSFFADKLRYGLPNVTTRSLRPEFVIKCKVAVFEAPAPTLDRAETGSSFSMDFTKFRMYQFGSLRLQEEKFHHASFLMILSFDPVKVRFDFLMGGSLGNSTVGIEQRTEIQI
jgi:hypothetical protein